MCVKIARRRDKDCPVGVEFRSGMERTRIETGLTLVFGSIGLTLILSFLIDSIKSLLSCYIGSSVMVVFFLCNIKSLDNKVKNK